MRWCASFRALLWQLAVAVVAGCPLGCSFELAEPDPTLIADSASWRYEDHGGFSDGWQLPDFDDSAWPAGAAPLGFDCEEATTVWFGGCAEPDGCTKPITSYFRHSFDFFPSGWQSARLALQRDDGAVVYINGEAVISSGLPASGVQPDTLADYVEEDQPTFHDYDVPVSLLRDGRNVVAVEVHQAAVTSSDLCFNLRLTATPG